MWKRLRKSPITIAGALIILFITGMAVAAPLIAPHDPDQQNLSNRMGLPSPEHLMGTDSFGRDVLSRLIWGARISLLVGIYSSGAALVIGAALGLIAGYYGKRIEALIMQLMDILMAFPGILLAIMLVATLGSSMLNMTIAIAVTMVPGVARLTRSAVYTVRNLTYVEAAHSLGMTDTRIILTQVLPNVVAPILVYSTLLISGAILTESALSFLGLGVRPPASTWGNVLNNGWSTVLVAPWISIFAGLFIFLTVMGFNLVGDGLRDLLDPRLRNLR